MTDKQLTEAIDGNKPEYILCAAIWYDDGEKHRNQPVNIETGYIMCGLRHAFIISLRVELLNKATTMKDSVQGFLTSKNRFVNRREAETIAAEAMQIKKPLIGSVLTSEDLY